MLLYSLTIFLGAFLLFQVQPLIARYILPWYGGGPGVWTACMLFFQVLLLVGYAYAHLISSKLRPRQQAYVHMLMLAAALPFLSIAPDADWKPSATNSPTLHIVLLLTVHIGMPFAVLSATSPLLTRWFSTRWPDTNPYRLYALSNFGSLLALLSYPFLVEPTLRLGTQVQLWSWGFGIFVVVCALCAMQMRGVNHSVSNSPDPSKDRDVGHNADIVLTRRTLGDRGQSLLWLALAATASVLLISTTSRISQDIAASPFMWVIPLAIYLISFIITFDHERWYRRRIFMPLLAISYGAVVIAVHHFSRFEQIGIYLLALFAGTMVCHGELVRNRPAVQHLTRFYLMVSAGGALGGVVVALIAPRIFPDYWELSFGMLLTLALAAYCLYRDGLFSLYARIAYGVLIFGVAGGLFYGEYLLMKGSIDTTRGFFGVIRIRESATSAGPTRLMRHGQIDHGSQFVDKRLHHVPTSYFGEESGIGVLINEVRRLVIRQQRGLRIGIVGLGAGTLCAYARHDDVFRIYEIDAEVERLARQHFSYLSDCETLAEVKIALGDARIVLERESLIGSQNFDILVLDAFSGDAVPTHLLTQEAIALYKQHLSSDGVLAIHATNAYIDLLAVSRGVTETMGLRSISVLNPGDHRYDGSASDWVIATENSAILESEALQVAASPWKNTERESIVWTDDFASIYEAMPASTVVGKWHSAPNGGKFVIDLANAISYEDRKKIELASRRLYALSDGKQALIAMTVGQMSDLEGNETLPELSIRMYDSAGLGRRKWSEELPDKDLLVVIIEKESKIHVQIGRQMDNALRPSIEKIFNRTLGQGISAGLTSAALRHCFEQLSDLLIERYTIN